MPNIEETDEERIQKAAKIAYDKGIRDAKVEARLAEHDRHLGTINGSIEKFSNQIQTLNVKVTSVQESLTINEAVANALTTALKVNSDKQVTTRTFFLGIAALIISLAALIIGINA